LVGLQVITDDLAHEVRRCRRGFGGHGACRSRFGICITHSHLTILNPLASSSPFRGMRSILLNQKNLILSAVMRSAVFTVRTKHDLRFRKGPRVLAAMHAESSR